MGDYCKWLLARCRGFSIVAQISLHVQNIRWLTRFFKPDGDGVFNVVNNVPQEAVVDTDSPDIAPAPGSEDTGAKSAAQISDMSKFFMTEGADYDLWCLPELHSIMAVPEKDKSAGVVHSEEGLYLRYFTVTSIGALLRILYMRHSLLLADESACSDPVSVTRGVVAEMRQLRKDTVQLGSGSLPLETVIFLVNKSSAKWLTFLFAVAEWRDALALRRQEKAANIARNMLALRGCVSLHPYPYSLLTTGNEHIPIVDGQRKCQQTVMQRQLFGSDGITMRGLLLADQLSYMWDPATKFHNVDRGVFADIQHKINEALSAALVGVNLQQVAKATEALLEFTSCACAADLVKVALVESQTGDAKRQFASDNHISKASANLSPAQILLQQVKMNGEALQVGMLQREADLMRKKYSQLSGKAVNQIPPPMRWPGAQDRFRAKVTKIAQTLEDLKASSDFVVSDDGENTLMIAEVELEAKMDALARELRTWGENEIADARRIERADAAHVEHLMHAQEHRTTHAQRALELLKKSFARRVDAEIIDRNYQQLLDNDRLRRKLRILRDDMKQQENVIRKAVRAEYEDLVTELASKLAASKARFKEFHVQLTQGTLHSLNDLKRETLKGMENHKVTPVGFKKIAGELQEQVSAEDEQRQESLDAQRAVLKIKTLYHMKEIKLKMEHKNAMDAIEKQEQAQKVSSGDGREMMEEKVALLQEQLDKTRDLVSTTEIELKNCRADLQLANRSKTKLMQRLMASKRRLTALETAGADVHAAQRQMDKLKADAERSQIQMEELAGIEQRAEQRNAAVELKTAKQLQRMRSTLRREQTLKLQAYSRLEECISDISLGQVARSTSEADVWLGKYQGARRALERALRDNDRLIEHIRSAGVSLPDGLLEDSFDLDASSSRSIHTGESGAFQTLLPTFERAQSSKGRFSSNAVHQRPSQVAVSSSKTSSSSSFRLSSTQRR